MTKVPVLPFAFCAVFAIAGAQATTWHVDASVLSSGDGGSWGTALKTIQEGIDAASDRDTVVVAEGVYVENIKFRGKNIVLRSTDRLNPETVAATVIHAKWSDSVVQFQGTEDESCVLSGFTIRNGQGRYGGGIRGGNWLKEDGSRAIIENNVVAGNDAFEGGGILQCHGTIRNNVIVQNSTSGWGGGLLECNGTVENNVISGNTAESGGGLCGCYGTIKSNLIQNNSALRWGGGLAGCGGTVQDNLILRNSATGPSAQGGGLAFCHGTVQNNTITGNRATFYGGGLYECTGTVRNCILWANTARTGPQFDESSIPTYSCIQGWAGDSKKYRNIPEDPLFLDPDGPDNNPGTHGGNDYRLATASPCIDAGYNDPALPATDIAGMHRIMYGGNSLTVDMGAYEFHIWPPTENSQSGEITLKWSSLAGKSYWVYHSGDMVSWDILTGNVPSAGDTVTTWIDSMGPALPPGVRIRYYKVMENQ
ncbi:MAG: right-handed parallel beta-helix repeat-containing protein [bacterium]|nr:right-handed parallel beta-helix repeat-containing protein [bacterium]